MKYDGTNLEEVLNGHKEWLSRQSFDRDDYLIADFSSCDIENVNFTGINLSHANFAFSTLRNVTIDMSYFENTIFNGASFNNVKINRSIFIGANFASIEFVGNENLLYESTFRRCYFVESRIIGGIWDHVTILSCQLDDAHLDDSTINDSIICDSCFDFTSLCGAKILYTHINSASFRLANLMDADLSTSYLGKNVWLDTAKKEMAALPFIPSVCPDTGEFIAWKACKSDIGPIVVKLLIPEDSKRSSSIGRKCRAEKAKVLEFQSLTGERLDYPHGPLKTAVSSYDQNFIYKPGEIITPTNNFCDDRFQECAGGIHFFIDRREAAHYSACL